MVLDCRRACAAQYVGTTISLEDEALLMRKGIEFQERREHAEAKKYFEAILALNPDGSKNMEVRRHLVQMAGEDYELGSGTPSPAEVVAKMLWGSADDGRSLGRP